MKQVSVFLKVFASDTDHEENSEHGWPSSDGPLGKYWLRHTILSRSRDLNHRETRERFKVYARNHHSTKLQTDSFSERGMPRPIPRFRRYLLALSKPLPRSKPSRSNANADADVDANADANERAKERERDNSPSRPLLLSRRCIGTKTLAGKALIVALLFIYLFIYHKAASTLRLLATITLTAYMYTRYTACFVNVCTYSVGLNYRLKIHAALFLHGRWVAFKKKARQKKSCEKIDSRQSIKLELNWSERWKKVI